MNKFNRDIFLKYVPSLETFELALKLTEKLGKLNNRMREAFLDYKIPSKLFAFIESKYSSKIEGIYTTLFDVVNTGKETNQEKIIKPLVDSLLDNDKYINQDKVNYLGDMLNVDKNKNERYSKQFGIWNNKTKIKIYEPPLTQDKINIELNIFWDEFKNKDKNVINSILFHLWFEKIHPFVDGNGRIGRLILNNNFSEITNFSNLLPISWSIFKKREDYYESFIFNDNESFDISVQKIIKIILFMYEKTKNFILDINEYKNKYEEIILNSSTRMSEEIKSLILFSLQTKQSYLIKKYKLNSRTVNSIFENINKSMDINTKIIGREKIFWNIELETIIDKWFGN